MPHFALQQDGIREITVLLHLRNLKTCNVVDFSFSSVTDPVVIDNISSLFISSEGLKFIHAKTLFLSQTEFNRLCNHLNKFLSLEFLYIEKCVVSAKAATILSDTVTNLKVLRIAYCKISETKLEASLNDLVYNC